MVSAERVTMSGTGEPWRPAWASIWEGWWIGARAFIVRTNEWLPDHVARVYEAVRVAGAAVGLFSMRVEGRDLRFQRPEYQGIDTSCVLHRRSLVGRHGRQGWWRSREDAGYAHHWEFLERMLDGGGTWTCTRVPTLVYNVGTSGQGGSFGEGRGRRRERRSERASASRLSTPRPRPDPPRA
jgi:hypothetical protein